jgi:hypothetical protein
MGDVGGREYLRNEESPTAADWATMGRPTNKEST